MTAPTPESAISEAAVLDIRQRHAEATPATMECRAWHDTGSLLALIDDLRARLAAAEGREASLEKRRDYYRERMEAAEALATTATARVAELEGALKPFAREADEWHEDVPDDYRILCAEPGAETANHGAESVFTIGDLRRARALSEGGSNG
ncbi:hypothetical protein AB4Z40_08950 [Bosea sp. 2YAB26]|uniref:hypothetical protein n=1 Tax=Bosea sp. 2YAB26 TaxID=3237478 RepID=UPI003F8F97B4